MRLTVIGTAIAVCAAAALLALPADAAPKKKTTAVVDARGNTVFVSRDEDGKTHTRIIIQKRSYLDPGTESLPGENEGRDYVQLPNQRASSVLDNTVDRLQPVVAARSVHAAGQEQSLALAIRPRAFPARPGSRRPSPRCRRLSCPPT